MNCRYCDSSAHLENECPHVEKYKVVPFSSTNVEQKHLIIYPIWFKNEKDNKVKQYLKQHGLCYAEVSWKGKKETFIISE